MKAQEVITTIARGLAPEIVEAFHRIAQEYMALAEAEIALALAETKAGHEWQALLGDVATRRLRCRQQWELEARSIINTFGEQAAPLVAQLAVAVSRLATILRVGLIQ